jgi:integrase
MTIVPGALPCKAKKRAHDEGTLRWNETKLRWIGRLMVGTRLDGKPDVREVKATTQAECRSKLDALKAQAANGTLGSADLASLTVGALLDKWLASVKPNLRGSTHQRYERFVVHHFKPALGTKRLAKLTPHDVEDVLTAKRTESKQRGRRKTATVLAPRTVHHLYVVLGTALSWAVKKGYLTVNPMARVDPPSVPRVEMVPLSPAETARLLNAAEEAGDPLLPLWELAVATGARKGEFLGLRWDDVDLEMRGPSASGGPWSPCGGGRRCLRSRRRRGATASWRSRPSPPKCSDAIATGRRSTRPVWATPTPNWGWCSPPVSARRSGRNRSLDGSRWRCGGPGWTSPGESMTCGTAAP